ncbi:hypothetical protein [Roseobacter weihaiensis]|uniref:hypothetical protein n=1 Tax=Roseobacter weihaiensis TaxID=2763262 RepID=UPI001D0AA3A2|nr:hypothetical protein [Roseobacter sp. H9]
MLRALFRMIAARLSPDWPEIDGNTVVLWEPCSLSHGEIVPGYAQILLDIGHRVVVLMTPQRLDEGLFSRFEHPRLVLTRLTQRQIARFVKKPHIHKARAVLISTAGKLPHASDTSVDLRAVFGSKIPQNLHMVEHDAKAQIDAEVWSDQSITLRTLDYKGNASVVVNPHKFGEVEVTPKSSGQTIFLLVGAARPKRRNQNLVYDAAERLIDAGETDFEIRMIGKRGGNEIPPRLVPHVVELGRLDFREMYREVENCDFIVTAFQADNPDHVPYKTVKTTGSFQLCYGFHKPCILQCDFATGTALTPQNSLFYGTDAEMYDALHQAINMSADAYETMQTAMASSASALYAQSVRNMEMLLNG